MKIYSEVQNTTIVKLREYINYKHLEPGDKLPSERALSEKFNVSRTVIREVIQKLELYGLVKSKSKSGTFISNIGLLGINEIIDHILTLDDEDFKSLVETRIFLELKTAHLAAIRRTDIDLEKMKKALDAYTQKVVKGEDAVQEDLLFHLAIAKAAKNSTMNKLMLLITPEISINFEKHHICDSNQAHKAIQEHIDIYEAIKIQHPKQAEQKMKQHFNVLYQFCYDAQNNSFP